MLYIVVPFGIARISDLLNVPNFNNKIPYIIIAKAVIINVVILSGNTSARQCHPTMINTPIIAAAAKGNIKVFFIS